MAKEFKDFTYLSKKLSDLDGHYVSVDFDQDPDSDFAFARDIDYGDTNSWRTQPNRSRSRFSDKLKFELHIVKNPQHYAKQTDRIFSRTDIRQLSRWLTSTDSSGFLEFEFEENQPDNVCFFCGQFTDIQSFHVNGTVYGLKLLFECSSPFGYTEVLTDSITCTGDTITYSVSSQDDRLNDYCYPAIRIASEATGQIFLCNLSDCIIFEQGTLSSKDSPTDYLAQLRGKIDAYALSKGYAVEYQSVPGGDCPMLPCILTTPAKEELKCMACYSSATLQYYIVQGGFLYMHVNRQLPVLINTEKLFIFDELNRMIPFPELGIRDVDYIYWPRLKSGNNTLLFWGENCTFTVTHREARKAGA